MSSPESVGTSSPPTVTKAARRASIAGFAGTVVEYYDYSLYVYLAVFFAGAFFPASDPTASTLAALAVFGSGYIARPIGAVVFGRIGDRVGRRTALMITVVLMGAASLLLGLLPTYAAIGIAAPLILVLLRLVQGFCAGGEQMGALTLVVESSSARRRGILASLTPAGSNIGFASATGVVGLTTFVLGAETMADWGWRLPFLLCLPLTLICLFLRMRLEDSPEFTRLKSSERITKTPVRDLVRSHRKGLLTMTGLSFSLAGSAYVGLTVGVTYLRETQGFSTSVASTISALAIAVSAVLVMPLAGILVDRIGRRTVCLYGMVAMAVLAYPLFLLMGAAGSIVVVFLAYFLLMAISSVQTVSGYLISAASFPPAVRYTGTALAFNVGTILGGAFAPFISAQLTVWTGLSSAPAFWIVGAGLVGLAAVLLAEPTAVRDTPPVAGTGTS